MRSNFVNTLFIAAVLGICAKSFAAPVDSWSLIVGITDLNQSPSGSGSIFTVPTNPFVDSHSTTQPTGAMAMAAYNFIWTTQTADFQSDCSLVGTGYPNANANVQRVNCEGKIWITPSVDALLSVQAHMDYALGPGDREASGGWTVARLPNLASIAHGNFHAQPAFGDPPVNSWSHQGSLTLLAGQQYLLGYGFGFDAYAGSGTQSQLSTGNASVIFHIDALPEPAALGPLAFAALLTCRPKKRLF